MKNIIIGMSMLFALSSCSSFNSPADSLVESASGFEVDAYDVTLLGVSGVLAKYPETYDEFAKVVNILNIITDDGVITADDIKLQIDTCINESKLNSSRKIAMMAAYRVVLNYFQNRYPNCIDPEPERLTVVKNIADATQYALELYSLSNGEAIKQIKQ